MLDPTKNEKGKIKACEDRYIKDADEDETIENIENQKIFVV